MSLQKSTKTQSIMEGRSFEQDKFFSICRKGSSTDLIKWLQKYPNFVVNQPEGLTGNTGLHKAALSELNSKAKAEILLNHGANPSVRNDFHETPAHSAAKAGNLETLKLMVEHGGLSGILMGFNIARNKRRLYFF